MRGFLFNSLYPYSIVTGDRLYAPLGLLVLLGNTLQFPNEQWLKQPVGFVYPLIIIYFLSSKRALCAKAVRFGSAPVSTGVYLNPFLLFLIFPIPFWFLHPDSFVPKVI